jgi:hypothetical protein
MLAITLSLLAAGAVVAIYRKVRGGRVGGPSANAVALVASEYGATVRVDHGDEFQLRLNLHGAALIVAQRPGSVAGLVAVEARGGPLPGAVGLQLRVTRNGLIGRAWADSEGRSEVTFDEFYRNWRVSAVPPAADSLWLTSQVRNAIAKSVRSQLNVEHQFVQADILSPEGRPDSVADFSAGIQLLKAFANQGAALIADYEALAHELGGACVRPFTFAEDGANNVATLAFFEGGVAIEAQTFGSDQGLFTRLKCLSAPPCVPFVLIRAGCASAVQRMRGDVGSVTLGVDILPFGEHKLSSADPVAATVYVQRTVRPGYEAYAKHLCAVSATEASVELLFEGYMQEPETYRRAAAVLVDMLREDRINPYR